MNRNEFTQKFITLIDNEKLQELDKDKINEKYNYTNNNEAGKNGIYFLYNEDKEIIYIGMTSSNETACFYMRMYGNGNASHSVKWWFFKVKYFRFKRFMNMDKKGLLIMERLAIYIKGQPIYNDIAEYEVDYTKLSNKL